MLKVNKEDNNVTTTTSWWCLYYHLSTNIITFYFNVSTVDIEQSICLLDFYYKTKEML